MAPRYQYGPKPTISIILGILVIPLAHKAKPVPQRGYHIWFAELQSHSVPA